MEQPLHRTGLLEDTDLCPGVRGSHPAQGLASEALARARSPLEERERVTPSASRCRIK
jgi:hypothetical protein